MLSMQAFHKWLSSTNETPSAHKRRMAQLARVNRARIVEIADELVWFVWDAPDVISA